MTILISRRTGFVRFLLLTCFVVAAMVGPSPMGVAMGAAFPGRIGAPCMLAWGASSNSGVAGYAVYYGIQGTSLTFRLDAGTASTITIDNLYAGTSYFFYVVAYDSNGSESVPSPVIGYAPQLVSTPALKFLNDGTLGITFYTAPGASCRIEYTASLMAPQWQTLVDAAADAAGRVAFVDPLQGRPPSRFYRAVRLSGN